MATAKGRILCTEDDPDTRELMSTLLTIAGYEIVSTGTAREALELAKTQKFDLYLMDYWLPHTDGAELTAKIREFDPDTPIIFCSGAGQSGDIDLAWKVGAQGYFVKPLDTDLLLSEIGRLTNNPSTDAPSS